MHQFRYADFFVFDFLFAFNRDASKYFLYIVISFFSASTFAGSVSGPNVVWVNLDSSVEGKKVDRIIENFIDKRSTRCHGSWFPGTSLLYMKKRPPQISDVLIKDIFLNKKRHQKLTLDLALKNYKDDDAYDGFDGIIVYANSAHPRMMRLTTGQQNIETFILSINGKMPKQQDIEAAFCVLLPPITRSP
jgi:hypothetical protein